MQLGKHAYLSGKGARYSECGICERARLHKVSGAGTCECCSSDYCPSLATMLENLEIATHASDLCRELNKFTDFASGPQLVERVGTSWAAMAMEKDPAK